tara:strand:+ start:261 stop:641 length:381 start_codon:yes stop_codon:yes gene_type:complete
MSFVLYQDVQYAAMQKVVKADIQLLILVQPACCTVVLQQLVQTYVFVYVLRAEPLICIKKCKNEKHVVVLQHRVIAKVIGDLVTVYVQVVTGCAMTTVEVLEVKKAIWDKMGIASVLFHISYLDVE